MAITNFVWDELSDNVLMETDENGTVIANYTCEPSQFGATISQRRGTRDDYFSYDGVGSTRNLTRQNQTVSDSYTYSAFGETVASSGSTTNPFRFNGAVGYYTNEETDDFYVRRRTYQPSLGRWMSRDPLLFVDGPNVYNYVGNLVLGKNDPLGAMVTSRDRTNNLPCGGFRTTWLHRAQNIEADVKLVVYVQLVCNFVDGWTQECRTGSTPWGEEGCCERLERIDCTPHCFLEYLGFELVTEGLAGSVVDSWADLKCSDPGCESQGEYTNIANVKAFGITAQTQNTARKIDDFFKDKPTSITHNTGCCWGIIERDTGPVLETGNGGANLPKWWTNDESVIDSVFISVNVRWSCCGGGNWQALIFSHGDPLYWTPEGGDQDDPPDL